MQTPWEATNRVISLSLSPLRLELPQARSLICKESGWLGFQQNNFRTQIKIYIFRLFVFWYHPFLFNIWQLSLITLSSVFQWQCLFLQCTDKKVFKKSMSQWHMECLNKFGKKWLIELVSASTFRILLDRHLYHLAKRQQQPIWNMENAPCQIDLLLLSD